MGALRKSRIRWRKVQSLAACSPFMSVGLRWRRAGRTNAYRVALQSRAFVAEQSVTGARCILDRRIGLRASRETFGSGAHRGVGLECNASNDEQSSGNCKYVHLVAHLSLQRWCSSSLGGECSLIMLGLPRKEDFAPTVLFGLQR
jgi:hypothetical protein